ncbi:MAG: GNAT family N-acetyltransferase [Chloroflexota bacterium]|nr:GNAT family N-acetyltransferase [Chloroflexota bacterium]
MHIEIEPTTVDQVADLRFLYARELDDVIRYEREIRQGRARIYGVLNGGALIGYGILHGEGEDRSTVVEFFLLPQNRRHTVPVFDHFTRVTEAVGVQARTTDAGLVLLLHERTHDIVPGNFYFHDAENTHHPVPGIRCRAITHGDLDVIAPIMTTSEGWPFEVPDRETLAVWIVSNEGWLLEDDEGIAGIGAILHGYNAPFASIGMVVMKRARRRGYGTCLIEELKRETYDMGKIPRADCDPWNAASRATLLRAGFLVNARALRGTLSARS